MVKPLAVVVSGIVVGIITGSFVATVCWSGVAKLNEELASVNETIHNNKIQFSLMQYTDDPQDFRDAIEQWSHHLHEITSLGRNIVSEVLSEQVFLKLASYAVASAIPLAFASFLFGYLALDVLGSFLFAALASSLLSFWPILNMMASMNDGVREILDEAAGSVMKELLDRSNFNDEYLQLMLFVTGHLRRIDEDPPWMCVGPGDLQIRLSSRSLSRHVTWSSHKFGWAFTEGCIPVTWDVLRWSAAGTAIFLSAVVLKRLVRVKCL